MIHLAACTLALVGYAYAAWLHGRVYRATGAGQRRAARATAHAELTRRTAAAGFWLSMRSGGEA